MVHFNRISQLKVHAENDRTIIAAETYITQIQRLKPWHVNAQLPAKAQ
jgi:hypothetical protein